MSDLHNTYLELQLELVKNFVVYVPTILSENGFLETIAIETKALHGIELELKYKNKLLLFDSNLKLIVSPNFEEMKPFYTKNIELQKNCFKLLELSQNLSDDSFDYLYINYLNRLNSYIDTSNLLIEIFDDNCPPDLTTKHTLFVIQNELLNTHLIELQQTIGFIYEDPIVENKDLENNESVTEIPKRTSNLNDVKNKKASLSKNEAIEYLLATVFKAKK